MVKDKSLRISKELSDKEKFDIILAKAPTSKAGKKKCCNQISSLKSRCKKRDMNEFLSKYIEIQNENVA